MIFNFGAIEFIKYTAEFKKILWQLRNHKTVRENLQNKDKITYKDHCDWVEKNIIKSEDILLFMILKNKDPIGFCLLRDFVKETAELGVMIKNATTHINVGPLAGVFAGEYGFQKLKLKKIFSKIYLKNERSLNLNLFCGGKVYKEDEGNAKIVFLPKKCRKNKIYQKILQRYKINEKLLNEITH